MHKPMRISSSFIMISVLYSSVYYINSLYKHNDYRSFDAEFNGCALNETQNRHNIIKLQYTYFFLVLVHI